MVQQWLREKKVQQVTDIPKNCNIVSGSHLLEEKHDSIIISPCYLYSGGNQTAKSLRVSVGKTGAHSRQTSGGVDSTCSGSPAGNKEAAFYHVMEVRMQKRWLSKRKPNFC